MKQKTFYYTDMLNDEFSTAQITPRTIDEKYKYLHKNFFYKMWRFFIYRIVFKPIGFICLKLKYKMKIVGKEKLKLAKGKPYFIYGNHTLELGDAFVPQYFDHRGKYIIVHPNNVSMKFFGKITPALGALPLPDDLKAYRNFMEAIKYHVSKNKGIVIYPEAHIWPLYTSIRPFVNKSFNYPIKMNALCYCFTNTYQKRGKKFKLVTYIDGPFDYNKDLSFEEQKDDLRNQVYNQMLERSKNSNVEINKYIKREKNND